MKSCIMKTCGTFVEWGKKNRTKQNRNHGLHNILCVKMTALSSPMLPAEG